MYSVYQLLIGCTGLHTHQLVRFVLTLKSQAVLWSSWGTQKDTQIKRFWPGAILLDRSQLWDRPTGPAKGLTYLQRAQAGAPEEASFKTTKLVRSRVRVL